MSARQPVLSKMTAVLEVTLESNVQLTGWSCPECLEHLEVHQPDINNPARLLGTCPECGNWYLRDEVSDARRSVVLQLPAPDQLKRVAPYAGTMRPRASLREDTRRLGA